MLTLSEKLLLLALHDEKGSVVFSASTALPYGLAGALLLELYLSKRVEFVDQNIKVVGTQKTDNELLEEALQLIATSDKLRDTKYWLHRIHSKVSKIQQRLAERLVQKKVLSKEEHRFLWVFNYNRYPTQDEAPEQDILEQIKDVVLGSTAANEEDVALLSLVNACDLVDEVFAKDQRKTAKQRIEQLVKEQEMGDAISQTVKDVMAAIMVVIMASTIAATSAS